jgi:PPP family 3-phenylpropionic acid transporter
MTSDAGGADADGPASTAHWRRASWRLRLGYLWHFAAVGAFMPFAALYYRDLGLSGVSVGILTALPSFALALCAPLWGAVSDALAIHRLVLRVVLVLAALLALAATEASTFTTILVLIGLLSVFEVPVAPLLDSYGMTISDQLGKSYGSLRVWGSLGYTAAVLLVGRAMGARVSSLILVAHAVCLVLALAAVFGVPPLAERRPRPILRGLGILLRNRPFVLLLLVAYLLSSGAAIMYVFLGIHLQELGGTASLVGLAFAISAASELPVVAFGGWFLRHLGARRLVALAIVVYALRFAAFSALSTPAWVLPIQALHGLSYGAFLMASVTLAHRLAGREHAATAQALLAATSFGLGSITGSLVGGALLDHVGTVGLFRGAAVLMVVTLVVLVAGERVTTLDAPHRARTRAVASAQPIEGETG